jgi:glycine cleavage system H protein
MSEVPAELKYASTHEWARLEADGTVTVGITDHAQAQLGDLVFVELPEVGAQYAAGDACAVVESVKAASDIYAPVGGTVVEVNEALEESPQLVNEDPYGDGWLFRLEPVDAAELDNLMDADAYQEQIQEAD